MRRIGVLFGWVVATFLLGVAAWAAVAAVGGQVTDSPTRPISAEARVALSAPAATGGLEEPGGGGAPASATTATSLAGSTTISTTATQAGGGAPASSTTNPGDSGAPTTATSDPTAPATTTSTTPSTTPTTVPALTTTSSSSSSSSTTTTTTAATTIPPGEGFTTTISGTSETGVYTTAGGVVAVQRVGADVGLLWATPALGYRASVVAEGPAEVIVEFEGASSLITVRAVSDGVALAVDIVAG